MRNNFQPSSFVLRPSSIASVAAIAATLLLAALVLRMGDLVQTARQEAFATNVAKAVAGNSGQADEPVAEGVDLPETERLAGMLALKNGGTGEANELFKSAIQRSASMVPLVRWALPKDEALARLAYGLYPSMPDSPAWLAGALASKQPEEALKLYREAAGLDPLNNVLLEQTGVLAQKLKHNDIAIDAYGKACAIAPRSYGPCIKAAELSYNAGLWAQVIHYFELAAMPKTAADWVLLIKAAQKLGRNTDAAAYLAQAKISKPADYIKLLAKQP